MSVVQGEGGDDDGFGRPWEWMVWKKPQAIQDDDDLGTNETEPVEGRRFLEKGLRLASASNRSFSRNWLKLVKKWDNPRRVNELFFVSSINLYFQSYLQERHFRYFNFLIFFEYNII